MIQSLYSARSALQRAAIIVAVIIQIGATFLPQLGLGEPIGQRSDSVRTLITPAGWAFAIWGPLFLGSAIYAFWQAFPAQKSNELLDRVGWLSVGALASQGIWAIYTQFANLTAISALIIAFSLACLLAIIRILVTFERAFTGAERWIVGLTFSALAAWLTAATIVNVSATLAYYGLGGDGAYPLVAAAIVLTGGIIAAFAVARSQGNPWFAAVFAWALLAIFMRGGQASVAIAAACVVSGVLVLSATFLSLRYPAARSRWIG
ncbi:hypothetical protein [Qipengyuania zhejiangensis]|uniref:hypothetical protein n=1 Tax=Qipengyuania zhejiangensis TaxID=3077782 RepID=UPI002D7A1187|nr:hypothetical protein [Qipengyuania sp. Z2]